MSEQMPEQLACAKGLKDLERPSLTCTTSKQYQEGTVCLPDSGSKTAVGTSLERCLSNYAAASFLVTL